MINRIKGKSLRGTTTILDAVNDAALFKQHFKDPKSWAAWRVFLSALFGLPLDNAQRELFRQCTQRESPNSQGHAEAWLICGRRGGKSFTMA